MNITVTQVTSWQRAVNAARITAGKDPIDHEPNKQWIRNILMAEHSPIRLVEYDIILDDIPNYVSVHLARHHVGMEKFVVSNREDRSGKDPELINRLTPVRMLISANAQALINMARKRLCFKADPGTRNVMDHICYAICEQDPVMSSFLVPECIYRGFCPEQKSCGFVNSGFGKIIREKYIKLHHEN